MHTYEYNQEERPAVPYSISGHTLQDLWGKENTIILVGMTVAMHGHCACSLHLYCWMIDR